jgi:hypothetical protein
MQKAPTGKRYAMSVKRTGDRLGKSPYQILRLVGLGRLEAGEVDGKIVVMNDSIDRYEGARRSRPNT